LTAPQSILPLDCADLTDLAVLQANFVTPLSVRLDQSSSPLSPYSAGVIQAGGLTCVWGGENRTDSSWDEGVTLSILGRAASAFADVYAQNSAGAQSLDTLGDGSLFSCFGGDTHYDCSGEVLIGDYWLNARVADATSTDDASARDVFAAVLSPVIMAVAAAGAPRALWEPPADAFTGTSLCTDPAAAAAALGADPASISVVNTVGEDLDQGSEAMRRSPGVRCTWGPADAPYATGITVLPGGEWAMDRYEADADPHISTLQSTAEPVVIAGTDRALLSCGDGCYVAMTVGGSIIYLYLSDIYDVGPATAQATAFAAALGA
jgi:hypothetical protein